MIKPRLLVVAGILIAAAALYVGYLGWMEEKYLPAVINASLAVFNVCLILVNQRMLRDARWKLSRAERSLDEYAASIARYHIAIRQATKRDGPE